MRKIVPLCLCILLILCLPMNVYAAVAVPEAVMNAEESVVRIWSKGVTVDSYGSGFPISRDGTHVYVVTNAHVVENAPEQIYVWMPESAWTKAEVVSASKNLDLCVLKVEYQQSVSTLKLSGEGAEQGQAVYAIGYPAAADTLSDTEVHIAEEATITDGIISAVREMSLTEYGAPVEILQMSAPVNPGNSGGPLFDKEGNVVGINTYRVQGAQGIFAAISVKELTAFLEYHGIPYDSVKETKIPWFILFWCAVLIVIALYCIVRKRFLPQKQKNGFAESAQNNGKKTQLAVCTILFLMTMSYLAFYRLACFAAASDDLESAEKYLVAPYITSIHDKELVKYVQVSKMMQSGDYQKARKTLSEISGYMSADERKREAAYQTAEILINCYDYEGAIQLYEDLNGAGDLAAERKIVDTRYKFAQYSLKEEKNYLQAYEMLKLSDFDTMENVELTRTALRIAIYEEGEKLYENASYDQARKHFTAIEDYEKAGKYLTLLDALDETRNPEEIVAELTEIFHFKNAAEMLLHNNKVARAFLKGTWKTGIVQNILSLNKKNRYLTIDEDGKCNYDLPGMEYGDVYVIEKGTYYVYFEGDRESAKSQFTFTAISPDCIKVYCHKDESTYTLYRQ